MAPLLRVTMWCRDGQSTQTFYSQQSFTTNCKFLRVIIFADRDHQRCNRCTGAGLKGTSLSSEQIQISQRRGEKVHLRCDRISFRLKTKINAQQQSVLKLFIPSRMLWASGPTSSFQSQVFTVIGAAAADNGAVKRCQAGDCSLQPSHSWPGN